MLNWLCVAVALAACAFAPAYAQKRDALVIANSEYGGALPSLSNPANDAAAVEAALKDIGFTVEVVLNGDERALKEAVRRYGDRLKSAGPDAIGLFYFAGHGAQWQGINFLIPVGAELRDRADLPRYAMRLGDVFDTLRIAGNAVNFVIVDACRNNPLPDPLDASRSAEAGLARVNVPITGVKLLFSAQPGAKAQDGAKGGLSPFAEAFATLIGRPGIPESETFRLIASRVEESTRKGQLPWPEGVLTGTDPFYFAPQSAGVAAAAPPKPVPPPEPRITVDVAGGGDYRSIQVAMDNAPDNGLVVVRPGAYNEALVAKRTVRVVGEGTAENRPVIAPDGRIALTVENGEPSFSGVVFGKTAHGIKITGGKPRFENIEISSDSRTCVEIYEKSEPTFERSIIGPCYYHALFVHQGSGVIRRNRFIAGPRDDHAVVYIRYDSSPLFEQNQFQSSHSNVFYIGETATPTLRDNTLARSAKSAIWVADRAAPTVTGNVISDTPGHAVAIKAAAAGLFEGNDIRNAGSEKEQVTSVFIDAGATPIFRNNRIIDPPWDAIWRKDGAPGASVEDNQIIRNSGK